MLGRASGVGNLAVLLGSSTGRDGIGGVSVLASAGFSTTRPTRRSGRACRSATRSRRSGSSRRASRCSTPGSSSASRTSAAPASRARRARRPAAGGVGMDVYVSEVPVREPGMEPFEVMTSESQERMLAIVAPEDLDEVLAICDRWEVRASVVGTVTERRAAAHPRHGRGRRRGARRRARGVAARGRPALRPPRHAARRAASDRADPRHARPRPPTPRPTCWRCWPTRRGSRRSTTTSCSSTPSRAPAATPPCCG